MNSPQSLQAPPRRDECLVDDARPSDTRQFECLCAVKSMSNRETVSDRNLVVPALRELVDALDRRVAQVERLGEPRITREAAALRKQAMKRIQELTAPPRDTREGERSEAMMADDGGPLGKGE